MSTASSRCLADGVRSHIYTCIQPACCFSNPKGKIEDLLSQLLLGVLVSGRVPSLEDDETVANHIYSKMPLFLLVVVGITFAVLTMAFRSVVIALKAALLTIGSALAAFGALVLVFQDGWG